MGVDVQRHLHSAVAESLGDDMDRLACLQQERCTRVAQAVKLDLPNAGFGDQFRVLPLGRCY